jgi:hypothetical protein
MSRPAALATAFLLLVVGTKSSPPALGQPASAGESSLPGNDASSQPPIAAMAGSATVADCRDADFSPACGCRWTASADFIALERVGAAAYPLVSLVPHGDDPKTTPGAEALNATDLRQGFAAGPQLALLHHGDDGNDFEVSYFQIDGWHDTKSIGPVTGPDGRVDWLVMTAPGNFVQPQESDDQAMTWSYSSRLYNAEVNLRRTPWRGVTLLAGFRWVNLTEELEGILVPPTEHGRGSFWDAQTKNNLYGLQIGADARLLERGCFSIDGVLKAGLFDNHVDEATSVRMLRLQFGAENSTDHCAFLGQLGVQGRCQVTPRLALKAGYEAIWLEGVALAPGQISETYCHYSTNPWEISVASLGVHCTSGVFYHGATAGLEYAF